MFCLGIYDSYAYVILHTTSPVATQALQEEKKGQSFYAITLDITFPYNTHKNGG